MILVALTILAAVAAGVGAERRRGEGARTLATRILRAMLYVLIPFVAFVNIARLEITADVGIGIGLGYVSLLVACVTAWWYGRRVLRAEAPTTGALMCGAIQANTGYLGLPLALALFGTERLPEAVAYDALVQSPALFVAGFGIGAAFGADAGETARERAGAFLLRNPPLIAVIAALFAPRSVAPDVLADVSHVVVLLLLPLGFFCVGVRLATESDESGLPFPPPFTRAVAGLVAIRLLLAPGLLLLLALPLIDIPGPYLVLAAMPVGINTLIVAHAYGLDSKVLTEAIAWSTAIVLVIAVAVAIATGHAI